MTKKAKKDEKTKALAVVSEITEEVFEAVVDEIDATIIEKISESKLLHIQAFWMVGEIIRDAEREHGVSVTEMVNRLAMDNRMKDIQMGTTNLWFAVKIHDEYPFLEGKNPQYERLPEGKNCSITKLKKILIDSKPKKEPTVAEIATSMFNKLGVDDTKELIKELQALVKNK